MTEQEIAESIFSTEKWYADIQKSKNGFMNAQDANRLKRNFEKGILSHERKEKIFNHFGYYIADKSWVKK